MHSVPCLPIVEVNNLLHSPERNDHGYHHQHPLHLRTFQLDQSMCYQSHHQTHNSIQGPDCETFSPELHSRPLVEEHELRGIIPVRQEHRHIPDDVVHRPRNTEEVHKHGPSHPDLAIVQQSFPSNHPSDEERRRDQRHQRQEGHLAAGKEGRALDGTDGDPRLRLYELGHRLRKAGEVGLLHSLRVLEVNHRRPHQPHMRERRNAEEGERLLRLPKLDVAEEDPRELLRVGAVVGSKCLRDEPKLRAEPRQVEIAPGAEVRCIEEDDDRVRPRGSNGGEESPDAAVVEVDHALRRLRPEGLELRHRVGGGIREGGGARAEEREEEDGGGSAPQGGHRSQLPGGPWISETGKHWRSSPFETKAST